MIEQKIIYRTGYRLCNETMKKICGLCGKQYTRKMEHIMRSHRLEASKQFISQYISEMNKTCQVCQNTKSFKESIKLHVSRKHLGRATKEFEK
jgi:hypothetical protein